MRDVLACAPSFLPLRGAGSASQWAIPSRYDRLHELLLNFIQTTGLSMLETDGPYMPQRASARAQRNARRMT